MALTTRANVLQRLGLTDDVTAVGAIAFCYSGAEFALSSVTVNSDRELVVVDNASTVLTIDLTSGDYDTVGEVATAINGVTNFSATVVDGVSSSLASTLLVEATHAALSGGRPEYVTYTNDAAGTNGALIDQLISESEQAVGRYCGRYNSETGLQTFESSQITETYDGTGSPDLVLRADPVTAVSSVKYIDHSGNSTTIPSTDYRFSTNGVLHKLAGSFNTFYDFTDFEASGEGRRLTQRVGPSWIRGFRNYEVTYTAGYATVPADLVGVVTDIVVQAFLDRRESGSVSQSQAGGHTRQYRPIAELVELHRMRLMPHMRGGAMTT